MENRQTLNIVANFSGVGARLIFSLFFSIVYFRLLGSEGYGLIGFFTSLTAFSSLFDLGLNQTTVREVARREADPERIGELLDALLGNVEPVSNGDLLAEKLLEVDWGFEGAFGHSVLFTAKDAKGAKEQNL